MDAITVAGQDVIPKLKLSGTDCNKIADVLIEFSNITDMQNVYHADEYNSKSKKFPNHKLLYNTLKISLKQNIDYINKLMELAEKENGISGNSIPSLAKLDDNYDNIAKKIQESQKKITNSYAKSISSDLQDNKNWKTVHLRWFRKQLECSTKNFDIIKKEFYNPQSTELDSNNTFGMWHNLYFPFLYVDFYCWTILQATISNIFLNLQMKDQCESINRLKKTIDLTIKKFIKDDFKEIAINSNKEFYYIALFFIFLNKRNLLLVDNKVLKYLHIKRHDLKEPKEKYRIGLHDKFETDIELMPLYLEEDSMSYSTFYKKMKDMKQTMKDLENKFSRKFHKDPRCNKGFFREIFMDNLKYNGSTAKRILSRYLNKDFTFSEEEDYYFFDEKINLGINRERCQLKEFWCKNKMQESLYHLSVLILSQLEPKKVIEKADTYFKDILNEIESILVDFPESN